MTRHPLLHPPSCSNGRLRGSPRFSRVLPPPPPGYLESIHCLLAPESSHRYQPHLPRPCDSLLPFSTRSQLPLLVADPTPQALRNVAAVAIVPELSSDRVSVLVNTKCQTQQRASETPPAPFLPTSRPPSPSAPRNWALPPPLQEGSS